MINTARLTSLKINFHGQVLYRTNKVLYGRVYGEIATHLDALTEGGYIIFRHQIIVLPYYSMKIYVQGFHFPRLQSSVCRYAYVDVKGWFTKSGTI